MYSDCIGACIDSTLKNLHKEPHTQHQWQFEAVEKSIYFRDGCKTTYCAYSSVRVIEIMLKPKDQCVSLLRQMTGLKPVTVYCKWFPSNSCNKYRPVEGFQLLKTVPFRSMSSDVT